MSAARPSIGKFQVVGQLGRGGMAEVYVCRLQGIGGFDKEVVVKRIVPERAGDPYFLRMFLDEARVASNLNHPNIVQVYEIGEENGIPYLAMEYVKGVTLGMVIREVHRQQKLHYGHALKIVTAICDALDYAHNAHTPDGEPLGLVHRDVTPGNIVISREGTPKLLDFGVAKAKGRLAQTEAGTIKGKIRYLAPEQVSHGALDHRADIFSLGVCMFELLTGYHPFGPSNGNEVAILKNIVNGVFSKPSELVPDFPAALEQIILWTIEQDVNKRCPSAKELREEIETFMSTGPEFSSNTREMVAWIKELFPDFGNLTSTGNLAAFSGMTGSAPGLSRGTASLMTLGPSQVMSAGDGLTVTSGSSVRRRSRRRAATWITATVMGLAGAGGAFWALRPVPPPPAPMAVAPTPAPAPVPQWDDDAAKTYLDAAEKLAKEKRFEPALEMIKKAGELRIKQPELNIRLAQLRDTLTTSALLRKANAHLQDKQWRAAIDQAKEVLDRAPDNTEAVQIIAQARTALQPKEEVAAGKRKEHPKDGTITITSTPVGMAYIDDEPIGRTPINNRTISAGKHTIQVRTQGYRPGHYEVKVGPGQPVSVVLPLVPDSGSAGSRMAKEDDSSGHSTAPGSSRPMLGRAPETTPTEPEREETKPQALKPASLNVTPPSPTTATSTPTPAAPVAVAPKPSSQQAAAPPAAVSGSLVSAPPRSPVPKPTLPRAYQAKDAEQVGRAMVAAESAAISLAGVTPEYARGITGPLRRLVGQSGEVYPVAVYYFIVREAYLKHDRKTAAANLASAYSNGLILKFKNLPAIEQNL